MLRILGGQLNFTTERENHAFSSCGQYRKLADVISEWRMNTAYTQSRLEWKDKLVK